MMRPETGSRDIEYSQPTVEDRLQRESGELTERLAQVNSALEALRSNPEMQRVINLVSQVTNRY